MKLRRRDVTDRPGLVRTVRIDRRVDDLVARARPGEIAVIDVIDLDRGTAEQLVSAGFVAVVNAAPSSSGRFPVNGPQTLLEAGVLLVDGVGGEVFARVRDGDTVRLEGGSVYAAGECVVEGLLQSDESVAASNESARDGLRARVAGLVADAGRALTDTDSRILEGDGFPPLNAQWRERVVVVITAGATETELGVARRLARRRRTSVIAVGAGADLARAVRIRPDLLVVGRSGCSETAVARAREVLVLDGADLDVPIPAGVPRAHAHSIGSAEDTAVLLAHARGASLVVTCGLDESLGGLLDRSVTAGSMPLVAQLRGGGRHVTADGLRALKEGRQRSGRGAVALAATAATALVVGLVLGAGSWPLNDEDPASQAASGTTTDARILAAEQRASEATAFEAAVTPGLIAGRLVGHSVTVVAFPGSAVPAALLDTLRASGAALSGPVQLAQDYLDPTRARVLRDLAVQIAPPALQNEINAQPTATAPTVQFDQVLAATLAVRNSAVLGQPAPGAATLLTGLNRVGAVGVLPAAVRTSDLVVLVVPADADPAAAERGAALAAAFAERGRAVAVVSSAAVTGPSTGTIGVIRSAPGATRIITVDNGDRPAGRAGTVLALDSVLAGERPSTYGVATDARAVVPAPRSGTATQD